MPSMHAVEIYTGDGEVAAAMRAHCEQHRVEALLPQARDRESPAPGGLVQLQLDVAGFKNLSHLRLYNGAGQPVLRESEI